MDILPEFASWGDPLFDKNTYLDPPEEDPTDCHGGESEDSTFGGISF